MARLNALQGGLLDRFIYAVAPGWAAARAHNRLRIQAMHTAYEAVDRSRVRRQYRDFGSGNTTAGASHRQLRDMARNLDRNHDLSRGILNTLVRNIVGATGIGVEPQPLDANGEVDEETAKILDAAWQQWSQQPEVTGEFNRARSEQLICRTWVRDGEALWQYLEGTVAKLTHNTPVPLSLELMEPDLLPVDYNEPLRNIIQGIEIDAWGRPQAYWLYKQHPGDPFVAMPELKRMVTDRIGHVKLVDRIGQRRGVSMFASVLSRLDDLKDYEESERVAARIAASMAAFIKKGDATLFPDDGNKGQPVRQMHFAPGMIFDDLRPGEDIGTINSSRPNPNAVTWCNLQMRYVATGTDVSYSSATKNYDGTYSAQRQEMVEQWGAYALLQQAFIDQVTSEWYGRFVAACLAAGIIKPKRGTAFAQLSHAVYTAPVMPWIDPVKEATGWQMLEDRAWVSGAEIVRQRGKNPRDTIRAQAKWQKDLRDAGVVTQDAPTAQPTYKKQPPPADTAPEGDAQPDNPTTAKSGAAEGAPSAVRIARAAVIEEAFHA